MSTQTDRTLRSTDGLLQIKEQPKLGFVRTFLITVTSIRYRLFRSIVTLGVITVAVAFLMNILTESIVKKSTVSRTEEILKKYRLAANWASKLSIPDTAEQILTKIARAQKNDPVYLEFFSMANFSENGMHAYHNSAKESAKYLSFFKGLDYSRRRRLVFNVVGTGIFDSLQEESNIDRLNKGMNEMKFLRLPSSMKEFREFLTKWPEIKNKTMNIRENQLEAINEIKRNLKSRSMLEALKHADKDFGDVIRNAGFIFDRETAGNVASHAKEVMQINYLEKSIVTPKMRQAAAAYLNISPALVSVSTLWDLLEKKSTAKWYLDKLKENKFNVTGIDIKQMIKFARMKAKESIFNKIERIIGSDVGEGFMGIGERMTWLVFVSMVVCIVGISNAMLMSVTERFREIAVLKCLGALDGSIMLMFVLEASILGIFGGIAGSILGTLIGMGRMFASLGSIAMSSVPASRLLMFMGISTIMGVVLASVASIYPSFKAARLAPMEAMRIE